MRTGRIWAVGRVGLAVILGGAVVGAIVGGGMGCDEPGYYPNQDPALRKSRTALRADSTQRLYPADASRVKGLAIRSQIGYMARTVDVANLTDQDFANVEVWVNGQYVCYLPKMEKGVLKSIPWDALYDREGKHLPTDGAGVRSFVVNTVELYMDNGGGAKLYDVPVSVAY